MTYNANNTNPFSNGNNALGAPGSGFGQRGSRFNSKRLSVALPPKVNPINENQVDNPTPRTSRSHLLAGLRTQPKTPAVPASAPYDQSQHQAQGLGTSQWADQQGYNGYDQGVPQTATGSGFNMNQQYGMNAGQQMYSLPEQVLAPPSLQEQEEMDPAVLQQMQMTSLYLAQRQHQLQQQLANITQAANQFQGMNLNANFGQAGFQQQQTPHNYYAQQQQQQHQQQMQSPIEVPGQPGVYLVYDAAQGGYSYAFDQTMYPQTQQNFSPSQQLSAFSPPRQSPAPVVNGSPPATERNTPSNNGFRSFTPPKKTNTPPSTLEHVEPLPPPSATAFRRGHKKAASSLTVNPAANAERGPQTASAATFGSQRPALPVPPMTGTFGPGAARAGEHPIRQPRGPPALDELIAAPTSLYEGSKNFATRQRRRALDSLLRAGTQRRGVSRGPNDSPISESGSNSSIADADFDTAGSGSGKKMSPIGSEVKEKRNSNGSANDGYFGASATGVPNSASSSEAEDGAYKLPPTPMNAAPPGSAGGDRKKAMLGVLSAAEKRRSFVF